MNATEFKQITGYEPVLDDLERVNCPHGGEVGHHGCGVCAAHGKPVFMCSKCFRLSHPERVSVPARESEGKR